MHREVLLDEYNRQSHILAKSKKETLEVSFDFDIVAAIDAIVLTWYCD